MSIRATVSGDSARRARAISRRILRNLAVPGDAKAGDWVYSLGLVAELAGEYDGFVVDLSRLSFARAGEFLAGVLRPGE